jgi:hypothetical protein
MTADEFLTSLLERAPAMRSAGILEFACDGFHVKLAPADEKPGEMVPLGKVVDEAPVSAADDPLTYGLPPGSKVPGFERDPVVPKLPDDEQ